MPDLLFFDAEDVAFNDLGAFCFYVGPVQQDHGLVFRREILGDDPLIDIGRVGDDDINFAVL